MCGLRSTRTSTSLQEPSAFEDCRPRFVDSRRSRCRLFGRGEVVEVASLPSRRQCLEGLLETLVLLEPLAQLLGNGIIRCLLRFHPQPGLLDRDGFAHVSFDRCRLRGDLLRAGELHHASGLYSPELHQHPFGVLQQSALKEAEREVLFEPLHDDDVLSIHGVGRLSPLALFGHPKAGEHPSHRRDLRLPAVSIRHLHASTSLHSQLTRGSAFVSWSMSAYCAPAGGGTISASM